METPSSLQYDELLQYLRVPSAPLRATGPLSAIRHLNQKFTIDPMYLYHSFTYNASVDSAIKVAISLRKSSKLKGGGTLLPARINTKASFPESQAETI